MKPEAPAKAVGRPPAEPFTEIGIPEEWVEHLIELGYDSVDKIKALENPGRQHQEMMGYRKKNRLDIGTVTMKQVAEWIKQ
jgi:hypothetical protein